MIELEMWRAVHKLHGDQVWHLARMGSSGYIGTVAKRARSLLIQSSRLPHLHAHVTMLEMTA